MSSCFSPHEDWQHPSNMSRLIKAITDMMDSYHGNTRKGKKSESFSRSEFKKLIQQEFAPVKVTAWARGYSDEWERCWGDI